MSSSCSRRRAWSGSSTTSSTIRSSPRPSAPGARSSTAHRASHTSGSTGREKRRRSAWDSACRSAPRSRLLVEEAVRQRVAHQLGARRKSQLLHDMRAVRLGRAHGNVEHLGDLLVRVTEGQKPQHLALSVRQGIGLGCRARFRLRGDESRAEGRMHVMLAARDLANGRDDLLVRGLLQDRKSTRLNSSHEWISYAVFCLKKKKKNRYHKDIAHPRPLID